MYNFTCWCPQIFAVVKIWTASCLGQGNNIPSSHFPFSVQLTTYQTCSLILLPSISTVRILKSIPRCGETRKSENALCYPRKRLHALQPPLICTELPSSEGTHTPSYLGTACGLVALHEFAMQQDRRPVQFLADLAKGSPGAVGVKEPGRTIASQTSQYGCGQARD